ncbi:MAG: hypothetical protein WB383_04055 [Acidimicrobiales bacterium]
MNHSSLKRRAHAVFVGLLFAGAGVVPVLATSAITAGTAGATGTGGFIEICKTFTAPPAADASVNTAAPFTFTVTKVDDGSKTITVDAGSCSGPVSLPDGNYSVTETPDSWYAVTSIVETLGHGLTSTDLTTGVADFTISDGLTETLTYTNDLVTGYLKICKDAASSNLTGAFSFAVSGEDGYSSTTSSLVGACSDPMQVPAGWATVAEAGTNLNVTGIVAQINGEGTSVLGTSPPPNLVTGTASVAIDASPDTSTETVMTYTNDVVGLKVCKVWWADSITVPSPWNTAEFPFTVTPATGSVLGPVPAPYSFSLLAGTAKVPVCSTPVDYRPGTLVTISEGIVPGSKVKSITTDGNGETIVTGFPSITGRTIEILVGTGVGSSLSTPVNEAVVTFTNEAADPGPLEICKDAGTPAPVGTSFSFTVSGTTGTTTVPVGGCAIVGGSLDPTLFPFNSTQTVTELASSGNATSAISVSPTYVTEFVGTVPTLTSELVAGATTGIGTTTDIASSVAVVIGEGTMTQVTFTDTDPPAGSSVGGPPVVVSNPGGSNAGTTIGITATVALSVSKSVSKSTGNAVTRALRRDEALLATLKLEIKMTERALAKAHGAVHRHLSKRLSALMARERVLLEAIKYLK